MTGERVRRTTAASCALLVAGLVSSGCNDDRPAQPGPSPGASVPTPAAAEESPGSTGRPAPERGEEGHADLPTCAGRARATILGTPGDDVIVGTPGNDVIVTFGGDDHVSHLRREDRVCTGAGDDTVADVASWQSSVDLGVGDDRIHHVEDVSRVIGGPGDDRLTLPVDAISVPAGPGDDILRVVPGGPPRFPSGIAWNSPCIDYGAAPHAMRIDLLRGSARGSWGTDRLINVHCVVGSRFDDHVVGSRYADDLDVRGGMDEVWALGGNDVVYDNSYPGLADEFHLGAGNDSAMSGGGPDRVHGGAGHDFIETGAGPDYLEGGDGNDDLMAAYRCDGGNSGGSGMVDEHPNEVFGGPGDDRLTGDLGNDRLNGGTGLDTADGGHEDGRVDWFEWVERTMVCETPF